MGHFYPPPPTFIGGRQPYAPPLGLVQSGPVPQAPPQRGAIAVATLGILISSWQPPYARAQGSATIAPLIPVQTASTPPVQNKTLFAILGTWNLDPYIVISLPSAAGNVGITPDQPPSVSQVNLNKIRASWDFPFVEPPRASRLAPLILPPAAPTPPPVRTYALLFSIRMMWEPPFFPPPHSATVAPLIPPPVPITPVTCSGGTFDILTPMPGLML